MSNKIFERDGVLYEDGNFGEIKIGEIKKSLTGEYVDDERAFGGVRDVERNPFTGTITIITDIDYSNNTESGTIITPNPFKRHGSDSEDFSKTIWSESGTKNINTPVPPARTIAKGNLRSTTWDNSDSSILSSNKSSSGCLGTFAILAVIIALAFYFLMPTTTFKNTVKYADQKKMPTTTFLNTSHTTEQNQMSMRTSKGAGEQTIRCILPSGDEESISLVKCRGKNGVVFQ
jgi:hypothetical protein